MMKPVQRLIIAISLPLVVYASKEECKACVAEGCTYCSSHKFFDDPSECVCSDLGSGFFGGCDDYSFGSRPLDSNLDCTFNTKLSRVILGVIIFFGVMFLCCCFCCAKAFCGGQKYPYNSSGPASKSTTPIIRIPATRPGATTTFTTVTTTTNTVPTPVPTPVEPVPPVTPTAPTTGVPYGSSAQPPPAYNPGFVDNTNNNDEEIVVEAVPVYEHTGPATYYK